MTATAETTRAAAAAGERLADIAALWLNEEWSTSRETELRALAHPTWKPHEVWALFEDLAEAVRLRDGINQGLIHWTEVHDGLTCAEPSTAAHEIACGLADDAANALLNGRTK